MKLYKLTILITLTFTFSNVQAQEYIYISESGVRDILRVNAAYSNWSITANDTSTKTANGIHLLNEVKIMSANWKKEKKFTVHDAFYFDINFGALSGDARKEIGVAGALKDESKFSLITNFGYLFLAGYREKKWAALAGIDFRWNSASAGLYSMPHLKGNLFNYSQPFVARGEYCLSKSVADKRAIAMLWFDNGSEERAKYFSIRLEYPLGEGGRWWLFGQYINIKTLGDDLFYNNPPFNASLNQFNIGFRVQNALL